MTRAEIFNGSWRIVKRHHEHKQIVAVSDKCYTSRRMAEYAYMRTRYTMKFNRVINNII
jgi:hypothetical protein